MYENLKTLKLDSSFRPIDILTVYEAFTMVYTKRANIIEAYDNLYLRSATESHMIPSVISLNRYVKRENLALKCSKKNVFWRDRYTCQYCNNIFPQDLLTLDHVTPRSKGGPKTWDNIVTSCQKCNQLKGNKLPHEVNMFPTRFPRKPADDLFKILVKDNIPSKWLPFLTGYTL